MTEKVHADEHRPRNVIRVLLVEPDEKKAAAITDALASVCDPDSDVVRCEDTRSALRWMSQKSNRIIVAVISTAIPLSDSLKLRDGLQEIDIVIPLVLLFDAGREDEAANALRAGIKDVVIADSSGGYLELLPERVLRHANSGTRLTTATPPRVQIVVPSDPKSTDHESVKRWMVDDEPMWQVLVEMPFEYFMLVDRDTTIQYINRTAPGVKYEDVIGKQTIYEYTATEQREMIRERLAEVFRTGRAVHYEAYLPQLDQWFSNTAGPVYQSGEIVGASVFAWDITEQKIVENRLKESERRIRGLTEAIPHVFYLIDQSRDVPLYVSPAYEDIFARPLHEVYNDVGAWTKAIHPEDRQRVAAEFKTLLQGERDEYEWGDYRIVRSDGSVRWLHHRAYAVRDSSTDGVQIAGVAIDVTAEKQALENLRKSEQKYRTLIDQASDGIFVARMDGMHVDVNKAGCEMLGYTREEMLSLNLRDLLSDEDLASGQPRMERLSKGETVITERRLKRKDGSLIPVEASVRIITGELLQAILRDITERKRSEKELKKAHDDLERRVQERTRELEAAHEAYRKTERLASIGTLAAGIAHEINNPLGSILMAADSGLYSLEQPDEVEEALKSIKADAKRAGRIVKAVLQFSRQEQSPKKPHSLGKIARRACELTRSYSQTRNVAVKPNISTDIPNVVINPTEIEQVLVNIINNAIDASNPGQLVTIQVSSDDRFVFAMIEDRGRGMGPEEAGRIFDPFYTTRHNEGGTGLGLSLTHSILNQHGGTISVDSEPGQGTRVTVKLPLTKQDIVQVDDRADDG